MAITPPTRTPGSLGSTKSNAQPVTNEPQQLAASDYNTCADKLIEVIDQSNANENAGTNLWEWNGVDATQFGTPFVVSTNTPGTLAGSLVVEPGVISPQPNQLRLDGTGQGVSGEHYIVAPILQTLPQSFEVVINSLTISAQSQNQGFAFFFWGDLAGSGHGYVWHPHQRSNRLDNGTLISGNVGLMSMTVAAGIMKFRVDGRNDVDYPHGMVTLDYIAVPTARFQKAVRNAFDATDGDWNFATLPPASWAGTAANRFGIAMLTTGNLAAPDWTLNSIKINSL